MATRHAPFAVVLSVALLALAEAPAAGKDGKLRVLLLSGRNNHDWRATTPALKEILQRSGRFAVTVVNDPSKCDARTFAACDVVVSNWTAWPDVNKHPWPRAADKAFVDFIRGGGGLAVFHAASTACQDWPEFQQLVCATWGKGTGHGSLHNFKVTIADKTHPVTAGMADFEIHDELWHRMVARPGKKVLCTAFSARDKRGSGRDEPVVMCSRLGKGRGFNLVLGHDTRAMSSPGWQTLMLRGTEWAATGKVTIPIVSAAAGGGKADLNEALKAAYGHRFGQSRKPLMAVSRLVTAAATDPAERRKAAAALAASLSAKTTTDYRKFACGQLGLVGSAAEVPVLAALLGDKDLSLAARSALERMPGEASLAALRRALPAAGGALRLGLIGSLGQRRDAKAVAAIAKALADKDPRAVGAAIDALGNIGGREATQALLAARAKLPAAMRPKLADALLRCAEGLLAAGQTDRAAAIYRDLSSADQPPHVRVAAFPGLVASQGAGAAETVLAALKGQDPAMQAAAVRAVRVAGDEKLVAALAEQLPKVAPPVRAAVIETLGERGTRAALPAVAKQATADDAVVRRAALAALARLGDGTTVELLARRAAEAKGAERQLARRALVRLQAEGIDAALVAGLKTAAAAVRCEMIAALRQRGARSAVPALLPAARDEDRRVRIEALKALGELAGVEACPALIKQLAPAGEAAERSATETALIAICRRAGKGDRAAAPLLPAMSAAGPQAAASLLRVLANLGGAKALAAIRAAVKDARPQVRTAAIRALAEWPDATPLEDLLAVARSATQPVAKVLALRGFVRLSAKAADRKPADLTRLFRDALAVADRVEEKRALLSGLAGVRCPEALAAAEGFMEQPDLANEAALAVVKIADGLWVSKPNVVKPVLRRLRAARVPAGVRAEASRILMELSRPVNLARDAKATSPDGWEKDGAASGDQAAIDGNPNTYWDEVDGKKLYRLVITFPEPRAVAAVRITGYRHHNYAPRDFEVLCDGKVVKAVRGAKYRENRLTVAFAPARCKSVELKITGYYGRSPAVRELEIYAADASAKD